MSNSEIEGNVHEAERPGRNPTCRMADDKGTEIKDKVGKHDGKDRIVLADTNGTARKTTQ